MSITKNLRVILSENTTNPGNNPGNNPSGNPGRNPGQTPGETKEIVATVPDSGRMDSKDSLSVGFGIAGFLIFALILSYLLIKKAKSKNSPSRVNYKKQNTLVKNSFVFLGLLLSTSLLVMSAIDFSHADSEEKMIYKELPISSENLTLSLNADTLNSDEIRILKDEITVDRDYENGLKFVIYGSDTELKNEDDRNVSIPSLTEAGTLKNNTFGFTLNDPSASPETATFFPLEEYSENLAVFEISEEPVKSGTKIPIWFAVRSKDLTPGAYNLKITYKAVSDFTFKMQDMDSLVCSELVPDKQYELTDTRDGKTYTVAKLPDGQCWMTSDLELDLTTEDDVDAGDKIVGVLRSTESGEEFIALNSENSDLDSEFHTTVLNTTLDEGWGTFGYYSNPLSDEDLERLKETSFYVSEPEDEDLEKTYYYHFNTATAGSADFSDLFSKIETNDSEYGEIYAVAEHSICPKGWSLPTNSKYERLIAVYDGTENQNLENSPTNFRLNGKIEGYHSSYGESSGEGQINNLDKSYYLSTDYSIDYSPSSFYFYVGRIWSYPYPKSEGERSSTRGDSYGDISAGTGSGSGYSVRCIADVASSQVTYNENSNDPVENFPESGVFELSVKNEFKISDKVPTRSGYEFAGWSSVQGKVPEFQPGETIKVETPTFELFASWVKRLDGVETLQEVTDSLCKTFEENVFYSFADVRDSQSYLVSKLADGRCWMVEDLKLMLTAGEALTSDTTDLNSKDSYTPSFSTEIGGREQWSSNEARSQAENKTVYYSGYDATANSSDDELGTVAPDSICPRGWYLPSEADYGTLALLYGNLYDSPASLNLNGYRADGYYNETISSYNEAGYYWASTNYEYGLSKIGFYEVDYWITQEQKYYGLNIRCVLDSSSTLLIEIDKNIYYNNASVTNVPEVLEATGSRGVATFNLPNEVPDDYYPNTFLGWWHESWVDDYSRIYSPGQRITTSLSTIHAIWGSGDYLYLRLNGGYMSGENYSVIIRAPRNPNTNTVTFTLPEEEPLRDGYLFLGWCQQSDNCSSDMLYHPGDQYTTSSSRYGDYSNLYAIWQEASPKAILDSTGNLDFVYDPNEYYSGNSYKNSRGENTTIATVCSMSDMDDYYSNCRNSDVRKVNFTSSFKKYRPTSTSAWFWDDSNLTEISNLQNLNTTNTTNMNNMFAHTTSLTSLTLPNDFGKVAEDMGSMFYNTALTSLNLPTGFGRAVLNLQGMFSGASNLSSITFPTGFGKYATDISAMFYNASSLTSIEFPAGFGRATTDAHDLFTSDTNLSSITIPSGFGRSALDINNMFYECSSLESINLPAGFGSAAIDISGMFTHASSLISIEFPDGFGGVATDTHDLFSTATSLVSVRFPEGFGSLATDIRGMFYKATSLPAVEFPAGFGSVAENMEDLFNKAFALTSVTFPTGFASHVTNTASMFKQDANLAHIYVDAGTDWNSGAVENSSNMFLETTSLTNWSSENANDITNAHIGTGGYFEDVATKPAE